MSVDTQNPRQSTPTQSASKRAPTLTYSRVETPIQRLSGLFLSPRQILNKKSNWAGLAAVVVIAMTSYTILHQTGMIKTERAVDQFAWYYDINNSELFVVNNIEGDVNVIDAPSGKTPDGKPAGYRASVFACGSCDNAADRFVGYITRPAEDGKGTPVLTIPNGTKWVSNTSVEADLLIGSLPDHCQGKRMSEICTPTSK